MKKIGLLTFHFPINYGAVLQTYGLYSFLKNNGYDIEIVNYYPDEHMRRYNYYHKPGSVREMIYYIVKTVFITDHLLRKKRFRTFSASHFKLTKRYREVEDIPFNYDCILTGSDQVFNFEYPDNLIYFQPFPKKENQKKIAYAPSFGVSEFSENLKKLIREYVVDFDAISCRENDGAAFLSEIVGKPVPQVLDPVFLLNKEEWSLLCPKRLIKEDYIFIYDLDGKKSLIDIAKAINKNNNKLVILSSDPISKIRNEYNDVDVFINSAGVETYVNLIKYASAVVTDAFHGTAFSLIFQRPFYTYIALEKTASRITSLLTNLGLENRIVHKETPLSEIKEVDEISFADMTKLYEQINDSKSYLINALYE
ncbi:MAG: polysaccharide pyruvyl transferase family protein [Bacteroidota bacterium]|nr:polysaccharide pyruvyl transferase family protein [Bacteroidota bacterium]